MGLKLLNPMIRKILLLSTITSAANILSVRDSMLARTPIIYPESFETDAQAMQQNWYLSRYADYDAQADSRPDTHATDAEIIDRLGRIPTTIELPFNSVVRSYIDMYSQRRRQLVENMLGMSLYYMPIFEQALDRRGMPLELKYLAVIESALNPDAVSRAGATGLWQFMIPTAQGEGLEVNTIVDQRRDPFASSDAAASYLKKLHGIYGDWSLAIAAYNCGPGNVNKALRRAGIADRKDKDFWAIYPFLPAETRGYVPAFIAATYIMTYYGEHNISPALARKPIVTDTIHVSRRVHFDQISDVLGIPVGELRVLNPQYRRDVIPGDIRPYTLTLPSLQVYAYLANEDSIVNHNASRYARRDVVQPSDGTVNGTDHRGRYVEEIVTKYHKVKRGETLASIAKRYGVTQQSVRSANGIKRRGGVKRGQRLRINTTVRRYIEDAPQQTAPADSIAEAQPQVPQAAADSAASQAPAPSAADTTAAAAHVSKAMSATRSHTPSASVKVDKPRTTTYTVRKGDNLSRIASRHGVSIDAIRSANGLSGDNINVGQKLKIPAKGSVSKSPAKPKAKSKSSRRRRR